MIENKDLETSLRESSEKLDYCASLIRMHEVSPLKENLRKIGNAIAEIADLLMLTKKFQEEVKKPWKHKCSFCKKDEDNVKTLIQGPGVLICNECVSICQSILDSKANPTFPANE